MKPLLPESSPLDSAINFAKGCLSKPQFRHFREYVGGLVTLPHKSIKSIARASVAGTDQSSLNRFVTTSPWDEILLEKRYLKKVRHAFRRERASLILDDSLSKKTGEHIEGVQYHKDHSSNGFIFGHQLVTGLVRTRERMFPLFPKLYSKQTPSKIELAKEMIAHAEEYLPLKEVVMDSWYMATDIIKLCLKRKLDVVGCIKSNRTISLVPGEWIRLKTYRESLKEKDFSFLIVDEEQYRVHERTVRLKHLGFVKLFITQQWDAEENKWSKPFSIISTATARTACQILRTYALRWSIETFHRDIKQHLGLQAYQVRGHKSIIRHLMLVVLAYAALKFWMGLQKVSWTIGETIRTLQGRIFDDLIITLVEEEVLEKRWAIALPFIRQSAKA